MSNLVNRLRNMILKVHLPMSGWNIHSYDIYIY